MARGCCSLAEDTVRSFPLSPMDDGLDAPLGVVRLACRDPSCPSRSSNGSKKIHRTEVQWIMRKIDLLSVATG